MLMSGWLVKESRHSIAQRLSIGKAHCFVVIHSDDMVLRYYHQAPVAGEEVRICDASGHIDLKSLEYCRLLEQPPTFFELKEKNSERIPFVFECRSKVEAQAWVKCIEIASSSEPSCSPEEIHERSLARSGKSPRKGRDERHVILEGYLSKRSRGRSLLSKAAGTSRSWAERRFCLYYPERVIAYFDGDVCKGEYEIFDHSLVVTVPGEEEGRQNVFEVQNTRTGEALRCCADSDWRAQKWTSVISSVIRREYEDSDAHAQAAHSNSHSESSQKDSNRMSAMSSEAKAALQEITLASPLCADCQARAPGWASVNNGVLVCTQCSGVHRSLGVVVSFVQSLTLDAWKDEAVEMLRSRGPNHAANETLEWHVPPTTPKPTPHSSRELRAAFITAKYQRAFVRISDEGVERERLPAVSDDAASENPAARSIGELEFIGVLLVKLVSCANLEKADFLGSSDPYVMLTSGQQTVKSKKISNSLHPVFNETIMLSWDGQSPLLVQVMDHDRFKQHDRLGNIAVPMCEADFEGDAVIRVVDRHLENVSRGTITLEVTFQRL